MSKNPAGREDTTIPPLAGSLSGPRGAAEQLFLRSRAENRPRKPRLFFVAFGEGGSAQLLFSPHACSPPPHVAHLLIGALRSWAGGHWPIGLSRLHAAPTRHEP